MSHACDIYINYTFGITFVTGICLLLFGMYKSNELKSRSGNNTESQKSASFISLFGILLISGSIYMNSSMTKNDRVLMCKRSFLSRLIGNKWSWLFM